VLHVGSHGEWKREDESILWWAALKQNEWMRTLCVENPSHTFYAEVFGQVQDLRYGTERGEFRLAVFDIFAPDGKWLSPEDRDVLLGVSPLLTVAQRPNRPYVAPLVFDGPYDPTAVEALAEGPSLVPGADHIREGIVIEAHEQRYVEVLGGRAKLKLVSNGYLERK
jgi:RNA ligase (TIGR02306 family)